MRVCIRMMLTWPCRMFASYRLRRAPCKLSLVVDRNGRRKTPAGKRCVQRGDWPPVGVVISKVIACGFAAPMVWPHSWTRLPETAGGRLEYTA